MGRSASARKDRAHRGPRGHQDGTVEASRGSRASAVGAPAHEARPSPGARALAGRELDRLVHERVRLGIVSALAVSEALTFNDLKAVLRTTDGNLSVHARKLEDAGYVTCAKTFDGRIPRTEFRLTAAGRRALQRYLDHMEALIRATREGGT